MEGARGVDPVGSKKSPMCGFRVSGWPDLPSLAHQEVRMLCAPPLN